MSTLETSGAPAAQPVPPASSAPDGRPRAKRSKVPWVVGGLMLAVVLLGAAVVAVLVWFTPAAAQPGPEHAVVDYDRAYDEVDCELFESVTTAAYRETLAPTCADFEAEAQAFVDSFSAYDVVVNSTEIDGATATVVTTETWTLDGEEGSADYTYTLVNEGGWKIDALR